MVRYLSLLTFTQQGLDKINVSPQRAEAFRKEVEAIGGRTIVQYWSVGDADGCIIFEAPDDATAATVLLKLGRLGNVRTKSMRVFDAQEFSAIAGKA